MNKALLVIDMQEVCVGINHADFFKYEDNLLTNVNHIIDASKDQMVIYIRNVMKRNLINKFAPFHAYEDTKEIELVDNLHIVSEYVFDKYTGDAFSNKRLSDFLEEHNIDEIEIVGVDGGGCVALTAIGASQLGYKVTIHTKAIGTQFKDKANKYQKKLIEMGVIFI
ncbi:MAG: isochorismatase family cysteine hydrolase [Coprobacillus sp.]